jgi:hypothetical protein
LRWFGNKYVWGQEPQDPQAVEIMYHAVGIDRHDAIYFGLSVVTSKTANILRTLAEIAVQDKDLINNVGRIVWGCQSQKTDLLACIEPFTRSNDQDLRERAWALEKILSGEINFDTWAQQQLKDRAQAEFGGQLPRIRETILHGDSRTRMETLRLNFFELIDDSFLEAFKAAAQDSDPRVRREVARLAGNALVWRIAAPSPASVDLMLQLAKDEDREVRYAVVYFGLSTIQDKSEPVIRRLIEIALADHEWNMHGRIVWGLKLCKNGTLLKRIMTEYVDDAGVSADERTSARAFYKDVLGSESEAAKE